MCVTVRPHPCVRSWLPHEFRMLLANFWTKYLRRSWTEGLAAVLSHSLDADVPVAAVCWQWAIGFFVSGVCRALAPARCGACLVASRAF